MAQKLVRYIGNFKCAGKGQRSIVTNNGEYVMLSSPFTAQAIFSVDCLKRLNQGQKLVSHAGDKEEITAIYEIA
jgi:hypothetical protein